MYKKEGFKAFFRGFPISIFLSLYGMISMSIYETSCKTMGYTETNKKDKSSWVPFIAGGISKCSASILFYPVNVIKTRQQKQRYTTEEALKMKESHKIEVESLDKAKARTEVHHTTIPQTAKNIFKHEGFKGFYKGVGPNLIRIFPTSGLFFLIYETTLKVLEE